MSSFFTLALQRAPAANVLILASSTPVSAALLGLLFGERVPLRTWFAIVFGVLSLAVLMVGDLRFEVSRQALVGDLFALLSSFGGAAFVVVNRVASKQREDADLLPALIFGGLGSAVVGALLAGGRVGVGSGQVCVTHSGLVGLTWILFDGSVIVPVCLACYTTAMRYLSPAEGALFQLVEVVLGPFWVWLVFGEVPSVQTCVGGAGLLTTLAVHSWMSLRAEKRPVEMTKSLL